MTSTSKMTNDQRLTHLKKQRAQTSQQFHTKWAELRQQQDFNANTIMSLNQAVQTLLEVAKIDWEIAKVIEDMDREKDNGHRPS
ncbi:MAG: hypothetical protein AAFO04_11465 [Cyanobacteria bacterium J06592_8]